MSEDLKLIHPYTSELVDSAMKIWMRSSISLIDIRKKEIEPGKPLERYLPPTSMFVYTQETPASIILNREPYQTCNYALCHVPKGTIVSIYPTEAKLQVFMILYKAEAAPFYKRNLRSLLETINPFTRVYGFSPVNPLFFTDKIQSMYENWNGKGSIQHFYTKALFYQIVHQMFSELEQGNIRYIEPDYVEWVKKYLDQHFAEQISIQELSEMLPISRSLLGKLFKKRENSSLQNYLFKKRLEAAQVYLQSSNATIQEIAYGCGFSDELNFNRIFKKYVHMTPSDYRRKVNDKFTKSDIDNGSHRLYNEEGLNNLAKSYRDGEFTMFGQKRSKELILAAAMSLLLLLSACTSGTPASNGGASSQTPAQVQQTQEQSGTEINEKGATATKMFRHLYGETEIPANPERIVVAYHLADAMALGVKPLGSSTYILENPILDTSGIEDVGSPLNLEKIMSLQPDLILLIDAYLQSSGRAYEDFNKIAPTVVLNLIRDPIEDLKLVAEVLGKEQNAEKMIADFKQQVNDTKQKMHAKFNKDETFTIMSIFKDKVRIYRQNVGATVMFDYLGLKPQDKIQKLIDDQTIETPYVEVSLEVLPEYVGDHLLIAVDENLNQGETDELMKSKIWNNLEPVKNGQVYTIDHKLFVVADLLSTQKQIEVLTDLLLD